MSELACWHLRYEVAPEKAAQYNPLLILRPIKDLRVVCKYGQSDETNGYLALTWAAESEFLSVIATIATDKFTRSP